MFFIKYRKIFYTISFIAIGFSIFAVSFWGIKFGIDFTGGSVLEFRTEGSRLDKNQAEQVIRDSGVDVGSSFSLRESGDLGYILRSKNISNEQKDQLLAKLDGISEEPIIETRFSDIGPTLGSELRSRAVVAIVVVTLLIALFIAFAFRQVSKPVSSWNYGIVSIISLLHDVFIPIGLFSIMGHFAGVEVDTLFVVAILVVLGYSINDTIVVFDRIRENLQNLDEAQKSSKFEEVVGQGLKDTMGRSINTTMTTLISLTCIYLVGGEVTKNFALAMIAGVLAGAYSSVFIAAPLLVTIKKHNDKKPRKNIEVIS